MIKEKLINVRKTKKFSQQDIANYLKISQTQYQRKEKGEVKILDCEWERIAELMNVPVEDILENDDNGSISQNFENVSGNYIGSNNVYCSLPEFVLENLQKYITCLEEEIKSLKETVISLEQKLK
ncbi:MAG: XRE family transcriptional regulator [Flavobacteriaceae bacterium]|jgi:transcriptional regulator with XRE-family HTH domain|nr:XRE family transcriptional regulator [Flavobacteriaceae bacterium]